MPSTSPGDDSSSDFLQILPGAPNATLQGITTFAFRHKRYVAYISGSQLNICSSRTKLVQALTFKEGLIAVSAESQTGKLAVAGKHDVYVLEPATEGWTKVWWEKSLYLLRDDAEDETQSLSWGTGGELLVGGSMHLTLFSTLPSSRTSSPAASPVDGEAAEERKSLWSKYVASPVQYAAFSPSATLIATCGRHDRLVKIWRRLSFEEGLFDYTYLPHPGAVTHLEWRPLDEEHDESGVGIPGRREEDPEILYTIANDGVLRVWRSGGPHDHNIMMLHSTLDLVSSIPQSPGLANTGHVSDLRPTRYAFVIPADNFSNAVTAALGRSGNGGASHALEHLKEITSKAPDVIVTLDGHGRMSAWGLQSIGHKRRPETPGSKQPFHIAHAEGLAFKLLTETNVRFQMWFAENTLHLVAHAFNGHVGWWSGNVETLFSPSAAGGERLHSDAGWSGGVHAVVGLQASETGAHMVSRTDEGEVVLWATDGSDCILTQSGRLDVQNDKSVLDAFVLGDDSHVVTLHPRTVALWSIDGALLVSVAHGLDTMHKLSVLLLRSTHTLAVYDGQGGAVWLGIDVVAQAIEVSQSFTLPQNLVADANLTSIACMSDANGSAACLSVDSTGMLSWTKMSLSGAGNDDHDDDTDASATSYQTGLERPSVLEANSEVAVLLAADAKAIAVLELKDGYVEHRQGFQEHVILLKLFVTTTGSNLLAVAFATSVDVLMQGRYDSHGELSTWTTVNRISVTGLGLAVRTIGWFGQASLAVAAGNAILNCGNIVSAQQLHDEAKERVDLGSTQNVELSTLASGLAVPVAVWHPTFVSYLVYHGEPATAAGVLRKLNDKLKFWSEDEHLPPLLGLSPQDIIGGYARHEALSSDIVQDLAEQLDDKNLPVTSDAEQQRLKRVLQVLAYVSEQGQGLDMSAKRFLFWWKLELIHLAETEQKPNGVQTNGTPYNETPLVPQMNWREIAFASHSTTQQPLLDILTLHYDNKLTWAIARSLGITAWLSDKEALEQVFESLAQSAYRQTSPPDPSSASHFFLALHKKQTLLGLWRIATWHKEQRATLNFLKRDFNQPDAKTAAKKNAYALMGKRRFEYAAAFFLLADDPASATSLLAGQCGDVMLAIAVARLYGGNHSIVLRKLLEQRLMTPAEQDCDRWMLSWCHSMLGEKREAAEALVRPFDGVRMWQQDDPVTLVLYRQLRREPSRYEYQAVLRAARVLRRMGLWVLALDIVRKWMFKPPPMVAKPEVNGVTNGAHDPAFSEPHNVIEAQASSEQPFMLDSFDTPPVADEKASREAKAAELLKKLKAKKEERGAIVSEKPPPTQFKEPDANSLLDSFGF